MAGRVLKKPRIYSLEEPWKSPDKFAEYMKDHPPWCPNCGAKMKLIQSIRWHLTYGCKCTPFYNIEAIAHPKQKKITWHRCGDRDHQIEKIKTMNIEGKTVRVQ